MRPLFRHFLVLLALFSALWFSCSCTAPETVGTATVTNVLSPLPSTALSPTPNSIPTRLSTSLLSPLPTSMLSPTPNSVLSPILSPLPLPSPSSRTQPLGNESIPIYTYQILNSYPHDREAFTEGLAIDQGAMYEGTGLRGRSNLRRVELETGDILQLHALPSQYFGEGITVYGNSIIQLTWKSRIGFVYDKDSFELLRAFNYPTEGWGITHDGQRLIMSDGTSRLYFLDPETLEAIGDIEVYDNFGPVTQLNELEYLRGEVYANVWLTNFIARIDPQSGQVVGWIDLEGLLQPEDYSEPVDVLNGIAYDSEHDRLFVTGKLWPKIFEIKLISPYRVFLPFAIKSTVVTAFREPER